jgi:hypothetical protein
MSTELVIDGAAPPPGAPDRDGPRPDRRRPHVSGDLPTVLGAGPAFDRALAGYDRFQVDTYVRWAEDELSTADREQERLLARHLQTVAALEEARALLTHSSGGAEVVRVSGRITALLAAAADEAEGLRAEARADRSAASAEAEEIVARACRVLADAAAGAERVTAEAAAVAAETAAEAARVRERAARTLEDARTAAAAREAEAEATLRRAAEDADAVRRDAADDAAATRLRTRAEVVAMLGTGREQRCRADAEAAARREHGDREAAARLAALLGEVERLQRRRDALQAEVGRPAAPAAAPPARRRDVDARRLLHRLRPGPLRAR